MCGHCTCSTSSILVKPVFVIAIVTTTVITAPLPSQEPRALHPQRFHLDVAECEDRSVGNASFRAAPNLSRSHHHHHRRRQSSHSTPLFEPQCHCGGLCFCGYGCRCVCRFRQWNSSVMNGCNNTAWGTIACSFVRPSMYAHLLRSVFTGWVAGWLFEVWSVNEPTRTNATAWNVSPKHGASDSRLTGTMDRFMNELKFAPPFSLPELRKPPLSVPSWLYDANLSHVWLEWLLPLNFVPSKHPNATTSRVPVVWVTTKRCWVVVCPRSTRL